MDADRPRERTPSSGLRCAVCRDTATDAERCERCGTWVHAECRPDGRCPTLGCGVRVPPPHRRLDPNDWRPMALLLLPLPLAGIAGLAGFEPCAALLPAVLASVVLWRVCYPYDRFGPP